MQKPAMIYITKIMKKIETNIITTIITKGTEICQLILVIVIAIIKLDELKFRTTKIIKKNYNSQRNNIYHNNQKNWSQSNENSCHYYRKTFKHTYNNQNSIRQYNNNPKKSEGYPIRKHDPFRMVANAMVKKVTKRGQSLSALKIMVISHKEVGKLTQ